MNAVLPSFVIFMFDVYIEQMFSILFSFLVLNNKSVARSTRSIWNVNIANRLNLVTAIPSPPPTLCHQCRLKTQVFFTRCTLCKKTRPDTWHKMRLVCVLFSFENNTGPTDRRTDGSTDGPTDGRTQPLIEMRRRI